MHEQAHDTANINPAEMLNNPDMLMQPELMQQVLTQPETVVQSLQEQPEALEGREPADIVAGARELLGTSVLGPELATKAAHEEGKRVGQAASEQVQYGTQSIAAAAQDLERVPGTLKSIHEDLPLARRYVHQLRDVLNDPRGFDQIQARGMVARMRDFADQYGMRVRSVSQAYDTAGSSVRRGMALFEEVDDTLRGSLNRIDAITNEAPSLAANGYDQDTLDAAKQRGTATLQQHAAACYEECEGEQAKVADAWTATRRMGDEMRGLAGSLNASVSGLDELPHAGRLMDEIDSLNSNFYQIEAHGPMMSRLAQETLDRVEYQFRLLEHRLDDQVRLGQTQRAGLERMQQDCMRLRQLPLFQA